MSRVIQWGVKLPEPENLDDIEYLTRVCKVCKKEFQVRKGVQGQARRVFCDAHLRHSPAYRRKERANTKGLFVSLECERCGSFFTVPHSIGRRRKYCDACRGMIQNTPGDGPGFNKSYGKPVEPTLTAVDEYKDVHNFVEVQLAQDLSWIEATLRREGFIWGKSATNGPHNVRLFNLKREGVSHAKADLIDAINYAKPLPLPDSVTTLEEAIEYVKNFNGWHHKEHADLRLGERSKSWFRNKEMLDQKIAGLEAELSKFRAAKKRQENDERRSSRS